MKTNDKYICVHVYMCVCVCACVRVCVHACVCIPLIRFYCKLMFFDWQLEKPYNKVSDLNVKTVT